MVWKMKEEMQNECEDEDEEDCDDEEDYDFDRWGQFVRNDCEWGSEEVVDGNCEIIYSQGSQSVNTEKEIRNN